MRLRLFLGSCHHPEHHSGCSIVRDDFVILGEAGFLSRGVTPMTACRTERLSSLFGGGGMDASRLLWLYQPLHRYPNLASVYCYSTDYPHVEGGKDSKRVFSEALSNVSAKVRDQFFYQNATLLLPD